MNSHLKLNLEKYGAFQLKQIQIHKSFHPIVLKTSF